MFIEALKAKRLNSNDSFIPVFGAFGDLSFGKIRRCIYESLVQMNHLIQFEESMSKLMNEPNHAPTWKPTNDQMNDKTSNEMIQQLEQDILLPYNLV
jgi:hypothetical protein